MTTAVLPPIASLSHELNLESNAFGRLTESHGRIGDADELRLRLARDGYLFLPGCLDREEVLEARREMATRLAAAGLLDQRFDIMDCVAAPDAGVSFMPELARDNAPLYKLLYTGSMMAIYERILGGEVRHFDFTWIRAISPGRGTPPHCDVVYMGRGTTNLYTSWTPLGDVPIETGGLIVLEGSHRIDKLRSGYCSKDVDAWCVNRKAEPPTGLGEGGNIGRGGWLSKNPVTLREKLGGRWLTADYKAGDLLIFSIYLAHAAIDNRSVTVRLSADTRYQLASEPVDERWIGENPIAHGPDAKRGMIC